MRVRAALLALVTAAALGLPGCAHAAATFAPAGPSAGSDPLGGLEASVDAISNQVDADTAP